MKKWTKWLLLSLLAIMIIGGGWYTVNHFTNLTSNSSKVVKPKYVEKKNVKLVALVIPLLTVKGTKLIMVGTLA